MDGSAEDSLTATRGRSHAPSTAQTVDSRAHTRDDDAQRSTGTAGARLSRRLPLGRRRVGAAVLEDGERQHREVDAVEACKLSGGGVVRGAPRAECLEGAEGRGVCGRTRAHDAKVLEDEFEDVEQVAREARAARRDGEEERRAEGRRQQIPPGSWRTRKKNLSLRAARGALLGLRPALPRCSGCALGPVGAAGALGGTRCAEGR